jgi:exonuclease SbcD
MKFLHTSDWHLGRQLHNQSLLEDQRFVLNQIVELAVENKVDAVVVAGDIYDRAVPPAQAVDLLDEVLSRLVSEHNIPVLMIAGNHDSHSRLGFGSSHMASNGLYIEGPLTKTIDPVILGDVANGGAAFFLIPYTEPVTLKNIHPEVTADISSHQEAMDFILDQVRAYDTQGLPKVVVSHCFIDGGEESESERPLSMGGADKINPTLFEDFAYTALGHLHGPQYKGSENIRYSGSPLKYSFSEVKQNKSVTLVELSSKDSSNEPAKITLLPLKAEKNLRLIEGLLDNILQEAIKDPYPEDYLMVRLLDKTAILDPINKLRAVYPNVLHLERTGLMQMNSSADIQQLRADQLKQSEMDMFKSFFEQVSGDTLNAEQQAALAQVIDEISKETPQ